MKYEILDAQSSYPELIGKTLAVVRETGTSMLHVTDILRITINGKYDEIIFVGDTENFEVPLYLNDYFSYYLASRFYIYDCGTFVAVYEEEPANEKEKTAKDYARKYNKEYIQKSDWRYGITLN